MTKREPPTWDTGDPPAPGVYLGFADNVKRDDEADIYVWDGKIWQHRSGWYDGAISHWIFIQGIDE